METTVHIAHHSFGVKNPKGEMMGCYITIERVIVEERAYFEVWYQPTRDGTPATVAKGYLKARRHLLKDAEQSAARTIERAQHKAQIAGETWRRGKPLTQALLRGAR